MMAIAGAVGVMGIAGAAGVMGIAGATMIRMESAVGRGSAAMGATTTQGLLCPRWQGGMLRMGIQPYNLLSI